MYNIYSLQSEEVKMLTNSQHTTERITGWIKKFFDENGKKSYAIVGISGGKDSATVAGLMRKSTRERTCNRSTFAERRTKRH